MVAQRQLLIIIGFFIVTFGVLMTLTILQHLENDDLEKQLAGLKKQEQALDQAGAKLLDLAITIDGYNQVKDAFQRKLPDPSDESQARSFILASIDEHKQGLNVAIPTGTVVFERPNIEDELEGPAAPAGDAGGKPPAKGKGKGAAPEVAPGENIQSFQNFEDFYVQFPIEATLFDFAQFLRNLERSAPFMMVDSFALSHSSKEWEGADGEPIKGVKKYTTQLKCRTFFFKAQTASAKKKGKKK